MGSKSQQAVPHVSWPNCVGRSSVAVGFWGEIAGIVEKKGLKERFGENFPGEVFPG